MNKQLILASKSPRRKELLAQLGYQFTSHTADIDESVQKDELPATYVERLAREKAEYIAQGHNDQTLILGSDTAVIIADKILGKPKDKQEAVEMLTALSGMKHQVVTGIAVACGNRLESLVVSTDVFFKGLSEHEIDNYWQTGEPQDKAGAYGIQGIGGQFVKQIQGSYSSVVGLPLYETAQLLAEFGLPSPVQAVK